MIQEDRSTGNRLFRYFNISDVVTGDNIIGNMSVLSSLGSGSSKIYYRVIITFDEIMFVNNPNLIVNGSELFDINNISDSFVNNVGGEEHFYHSIDLIIESSNN